MFVLHKSGEEDMRNWLVGGLVAGLAVTGIVIIVQAAIPDPSGVIHACYRPNGNLRLGGQVQLRQQRNGDFVEPDWATGASR